jgi:predicted  nucleic acid-binding Zn-ribbon protein
MTLLSVVADTVAAVHNSTNPVLQSLQVANDSLRKRNDTLAYANAALRDELFNSSHRLEVARMREEELQSTMDKLRREFREFRAAIKTEAQSKYE